MTDWLAERQRRAEERWRQAQRLGAFVDVGRVVQIGDEDAEVVATLADATQTVVAYRTPPGSDAFPSPLRPFGGASGGVMGDLAVAHLPPADGSTILVDFGRFKDDGGHEVELPIDRARTRPFERRSAEPPLPLMIDGARLAVRGAAVGLLLATIDLDITSDDPALAAAGLGSRGFLPHPHRRAGSGPLWRDWHPPSDPSQNDQGPRSGSPSSGSVRSTFRASATARLTAVAAPAGTTPAPPAVPPRPWQVRALPAGQALDLQGSETGGGPIPETLSLRATLRFDPPPDDASGLELTLDELYLFRTCSGQPVEVPVPRAGEGLDLADRSIVCGSERVDLVRWEPAEHGTPRLVVRPSQPDRRPDIRVIADQASVSVWLHPSGERELAGGLPGIYRPLFPAGGHVTLGLRMLGRKAELPPITVPLAPPETRST